jgi:5'-methylthioadenosine phosphorylase
MAIRIGIIGGSGLYKMGILDDCEEITVETPFGSPSDKITIGKIQEIPVAFLPRHGKYHQFPPHMVNYQANVFAMKTCGVEYLISTAVVGSLKKEIKPCDFVIADQLIDRTFKRKNTFFEQDMVAHVGFADPFCKPFSDLAFNLIQSKKVDVHHGTYICIEGPQFSTRAESNLYRKWNADIIGMTLASEAKLAREAELCLCGILTVTDYDCWIEGEEDVSVLSVVENLKKNDEHMADIIHSFIPLIDYQRNCSCCSSLKHAVITNPELIKKKVHPMIRKTLFKNYI